MDTSTEEKAAPAADASLPAVLTELAARAQAGEFTGALLLLVRPDQSAVPVMLGTARDDPYRLAGMCMALAQGALRL